MKTLSAPTEQFIKGEITTITEAVEVGSSVQIPVENGSGYSIADFVAVGYEGRERVELVQITDVDEVSITVAELNFEHYAGEPITLYRFNQRKFYGATEDGGTYTELTGDGSPKDIQVDDPMGTSLEYTGALYTYFKSTYYNSETDTETSIDDANAVAGDQTSRYQTIEAIRKRAGLQGNFAYSDARIEAKRKVAENEIDSAIAARYVLPLAEVPALIAEVCEMIAAGLIITEEFGASESDDKGGSLVSQARSILKSIIKGERLLIGADKTELTRVENSGQLSGYPDDVCEDKAKFGMGQIF